MMGRGEGTGQGGGMMGSDRRSRHSSGPGRMGPGMMMVMMDTDGDGALSLEEDQAG